MKRAGLLPWLSGYGFEGFRHDLAAGLSVGVLLVPQSMAYAHLAGLPAIYGLYACVIPPLAYALLGTSMHLAAGIVAIDMLIIHSGLEGLADPGSERWITLAIQLTLMTGTIQVLMALSRLGFLMTLLSRPVLAGFASGAAILIALSALGSLVAIDLHGASTLPAMVWELARGAATASPWPLLLGAGAIAALLALRAWRPLFPAALAVVVSGSLAVAFLDPEGRAIELVGSVAPGLPSLAIPRLDGEGFGALLPTAATLALVQFTTVASLGKMFAARFGYSIRANRELTAIGVANLGGSLFGALPVSASFSRSALNVASGARTPMANAVAAAVVVSALLFFTDLLARIPEPVLAAIIVVATLSLVDVEEIRLLRRAKTADGWIAVITILTTLGAGILAGIVVGITVSVLAILYRIGRPNAAVLGRVPGTELFRDVRHSPEAREPEGILLLRIDASFSFINAEFLQDLILARTGADPRVRAVVLDASSVNDLDTTAAEVLGALKEALGRRGVSLSFGSVKEPVLDTLRRSGLYERLGPERFFATPQSAVEGLLPREAAGEETGVADGEREPGLR